MSNRVEELVSALTQLSDEDQIAVIEGVLNARHAVDPKTESVWAEEVAARRKAYLAGTADTINYKVLRSRYAR